MEPIFDKVEDFAMEFFIRMVGESFFFCRLFPFLLRMTKGHIVVNILTSDEQVEEWIQQYVPFEAFVRIRNMMQKALETSYATSYMGFLGVDMMVCRQKEGHPYAINPHVE